MHSAMITGHTYQGGILVEVDTALKKIVVRVKKVNTTTPQS